MPPAYSFGADINQHEFLPRDARSAKRGIAVVGRPRLSLRTSVTLMYCGRMSWVSSKLITRIISLGSSLLGATTSAIYLVHSQNSGGIGVESLL